MKALDRYLRDVRIARAGAFVRRGDVVVDVGCADGAMFDHWKDRIRYGYGVDPTLQEVRKCPRYVLYPGVFPDALPPVKCDVVTMLAVLEHVPPEDQARLPAACFEILRPGGRIILTVPSSMVDRILKLLGALRLIDGMSMDEHYGFGAEVTVEIFRPPFFRLSHRRRFQLGLNNLFVFERI